MTCTKHIPMRKCVGCNVSTDKSLLIRIVKEKDVVSIDTIHKKNGRGAYICKNLACLEKARKSRRIERSLSIGITDEMYKFLGERISEYGN